MTDDAMNAVKNRITLIVEREKSLNQKSVKDRKEETARRAAEQQKEQAALATLRNKEAQEIDSNTRRDHASQEVLRREGDIVHLSEDIQRGYVEEVRRHQAAERKLEEQATALEARLSSLKGARP